MPEVVLDTLTTKDAGMQRFFVDDVCINAEDIKGRRVAPTEVASQWLWAQATEHGSFSEAEAANASHRNCTVAYHSKFSLKVRKGYQCLVVPTSLNYVTWVLAKGQGSKML